jgi:hypothetical protein
MILVSRKDYNILRADVGILFSEKTVGAYEVAFDVQICQVE